MMETDVTNFMVSKIKNIWLRRFVIGFTTPFLYVINFFLAVAYLVKIAFYTMSVFIAIGIIQFDFFQSVKKQWNENERSTSN